jgi:hypothetical protein
MSKVLKLKSKNEFVRNFLQPISKISDASVLEVSGQSLNCLTCTSDNSVILSIQFNIGGDIEELQTLNCPDIKKLIKAIDTIKEDEIEFHLENNNLAYKGKNLRFKYHLQEDGIIKKPKLNLKKLEETDFHSLFVLEYEKIKELIKGSVFSSDSNKIYLMGNNEGVYAELTDKTRNNIDTITIKVADKLEGESVNSLPLSFEIFRIMETSGLKNILVKINNKLGIVIFQIENNYNKMTYIMSSLTK